MSAETIKSEIYKRRGDIPDAEVCLKIVDFVSSLSEKHRSFLTYESFIKGLDNQFDRRRIFDAVTFLASSRIEALDTKGMFVDDCEHEYELSRYDLWNVLNTGTFVHPDTGNVVQDAKNRVFLFFVPSTKFEGEQR